MSRPNKLLQPRRGRPPREAIYERLRVQIGELRDRLGGLPAPDEAEGIWRGIWLEEAHHSTALEGNTLVLKQVEQLLEEGRAVGSKELSEYLEVRGYADAAGWVYGKGVDPDGRSGGKLITLSEVRQVHSLAMTPVWDVAPRPQSHELPGALAALHSRFEQVHPFLDGNGRTGRLVLNLLLVRLGYPPAIIYKGSRARYLTALRRADQGDLGPLGEFLARAILDNLHKFVVPAIAGPARLVPLPALATGRLSANALRVAATRGRLKAAKAADGTWRSSAIWVEEYEASRYKRG